MSDSNEQTGTEPHTPQRRATGMNPNFSVPYGQGSNAAPSSYKCSRTRLREAVIAFYFVGLFTGCCTHRYQTLATVLGICSMIMICVQWWRIQSLNEREQNSRR